MIDGLSAEQERRVLIDRSTRKMVIDILKMSETRDPCDAARDSELAARILSGRFDRLLKAEEEARVFGNPGPTDAEEEAGRAPEDAHAMGARAEKAWKSHDAETQRKLRAGIDVIDGSKPATGEELKRLADDNWEGGES